MMFEIIIETCYVINKHVQLSSYTIYTQLPTFIERTVMMACAYMLSRATLTTSFSSFTGVTNLVDLI